MAFEQNHFSGSDIYNLDRADLKEYGIINLDDRKTIYKAMEKLIVAQKRRDSLESPKGYTQDIDHHEIMTSPRLSDMIQDKGSEDDNYISDHPDLVIRAISQHYSYAEPSSGEEFEEKELEEMVSIDYTSILLPREQFLEDFYGEKGFTQWVHHPRYEQTVDALTVGYIRNNADNKQQRVMLSDVYKIIVNYYSINTTSFNDYVEIQSGQTILFTSMAHISLSKLLVSRAKQSTVNGIIIEQSEVKTEILKYILEYLAHHKENEFEHTLAWTDKNSMNTGQIVSDEWDRDWINAFDINTLSSIKEAARYLKIISLVQLAGIPMITQLFDMTIFRQSINQ